jgi:hypothetical protein
MSMPGNKSRSLRRTLLIATLSILTLATGSLLFLLSFQSRPIELHLAGDSREIGTVYGRELGLRTRLLTRIYLDGIVCGRDKDLIKARRAQAMLSVTNWPPAYAEELAAFSAAAGVDQSAIAYGNCFLDLGNTRAGCRSVVIATNEIFLHAHNLDWDSLGGLGRWTTCIIRRKPAKSRKAGA